MLLECETFPSASYPVPKSLRLSRFRSCVDVILLAFPEAKGRCGWDSALGAWKLEVDIPDGSFRRLCRSEEFETDEDAREVGVDTVNHMMRLLRDANPLKYLGRMMHLSNVLSGERFGDEED